MRTGWLWAAVKRSVCLSCGSSSSSINVTFDRPSFPVLSYSENLDHFEPEDGVHSNTLTLSSPLHNRNKRLLICCTLAWRHLHISHRPIFSMCFTGFNSGRTTCYRYSQSAGESQKIWVGMFHACSGISRISAQYPSPLSVYVLKQKWQSFSLIWCWRAFKNLCWNSTELGTVL